ncbi:MAG: UDP-4-amino-4-deoxy-L-arabinose-oxoglutarate aminotransferase [Verrucomicrobia bacterium GWC2_42_7]|nr:MAG: UDP-4-amino-4-deoxy-L-arabinose-oxoglutarate aminotransferase [Verrucomicrobia bacterium GWC2_42_7]
MGHIYLSIVIPVFNEQENLERLFTRLTAALDAMKQPSEIVFVNDGSSDNSFKILKNFHERRPQQVRIIDFNGNYGQHTAIIAAFERVRGKIIVTLDADLQNPPEEIQKLVAKVEEGYDVVGGFRAQREDSWFRRYASKLNNKIRKYTTNIEMTDQGCMLRAYARHIVDAIVRCGERTTFIPALAYKFAANPGEVEVAHSARLGGQSKYSLYKLIRLNFDLITGFTLVPLQLFTILGFIVSGLSAILVVVLVVRRILIGPEVQGIFTLFAVLFFLISVAITGIGLVGEYVGRTYQAVQQRPRYILRQILDKTSEE